MSNLMRCPKWESCKKIKDCRVKIPHIKTDDCDSGIGKCPPCVPVESNQTKCPTCEGSGEIQTNDETDLTIIMDCPTCNGTGVAPMPEMKRIEKVDFTIGGKIHHISFMNVLDQIPMLALTIDAQLSADQSIQASREAKLREQYEARIIHYSEETAKLLDESEKQIEELNEEIKRLKGV